MDLDCSIQHDKNGYANVFWHIYAQYTAIIQNYYEYSDKTVLFYCCRFIYDNAGDNYDFADHDDNNHD